MSRSWLLGLLLGVLICVVTAASIAIRMAPSRYGQPVVNVEIALPHNSAAEFAPVIDKFAAANQLTVRRSQEQQGDEVEYSIELEGADIGLDISTYIADPDVWEVNVMPPAGGTLSSARIGLVEDGLQSAARAAGGEMLAGRIPAGAPSRNFVAEFPITPSDDQYDSLYAAIADFGNESGFRVLPPRSNQFHMFRNELIVDVDRGEGGVSIAFQPTVVGISAADSGRLSDGLTAAVASAGAKLRETDEVDDAGVLAHYTVTLRGGTAPAFAAAVTSFANEHGFVVDVDHFAPANPDVVFLTLERLDVQFSVDNDVFAEGTFDVLVRATQQHEVSAGDLKVLLDQFVDAAQALPGAVITPVAAGNP